jgi:hypothetical protein
VHDLCAVRCGVSVNRKFSLNYRFGTSSKSMFVSTLSITPDNGQRGKMVACNCTMQIGIC